MNCRQLLMLAFFTAVVACGREPAEVDGEVRPARPPLEISPWILSPLAEDTPLAEEIHALQERIRREPGSRDALLDLGRHYIALARRAFDDGYYRLAEQTASSLLERDPRDCDARLLRGHALFCLHRFSEVEQLARVLIRDRGGLLDHGLLGDALIELGDLEGATEAYQRMIDQRPCLQSYTRAGHIRWLRGDLEGACELFQLATEAGSPRDAESLAWTHARLAGLELQRGRYEKASRDCEIALALEPDHAPALLERGRLELARGENEQACETLERAVEQNPLPGYRWALIEALREAGRVGQAEQQERELLSVGAQEDPRSFAVFLASQGQDPEEAVRLARAELAERADVFTHAALAWALAQADELEAATTHLEHAMAWRTADPRIYLHAGLIACRRGERSEAKRLLERARSWQDLLWPSERRRLKAELASL